MFAIDCPPIGGRGNGKKSSAGKEDEAPRRPPEVAQAIDDAIAALSGKKRKSRKEVKPHE